MHQLIGCTGFPADATHAKQAGDHVLAGVSDSPAAYEVAEAQKNEIAQAFFLPLEVDPLQPTHFAYRLVGRLPVPQCFQ